MEIKCKCPKCKKQDMVYPSTIGGYVCLRCCYMFDERKKHDSKTVNQ